MKKIFTPFIVLLLPVVANAQVGTETFGIMTTARGQLQKTVPFHGGLGFGLFCTLPKYNALSFGWRVSGNFYASSKQEWVPFYADDYVHEQATITDNHSISLNSFYMRYELMPQNGIVPFAELGGGWATYKSRWSAIDPMEQDNNDCEGYHKSDTYRKDRTPVATATLGVNIKFNRIFNPGNCSGFWLTLACDYSRGNTVTHLNSKLNPQQFYYDPKYQTPPAPATDPRPRHGGHTMTTTTPSTPVMTDDEYLAQPEYKAKHELVQFRIALTWFFGDCD